MAQLLQLPSQRLVEHFMEAGAGRVGCWIEKPTILVAAPLLAIARPGSFEPCRP